MCMYKKCICLISLVFLLGMVGNVSAVDRNWTNGNGDRLWSTAANWSGSTIPTIADKAAIRNSAISGPIINSSTTAVANQIVVGDWSSTRDTLDMTGGILTTSGTSCWVVLGYGAANNGIFTMSAGTANFGNNFYVGLSGKGLLQMTGGTIAVGLTFGIAQNTGSIADVNLYGGTITCGTFNMTSGGAMDITAGTLIVNGDATTLVNTYITNSWITAYGGSGTVNIDYNVTNPGKTTVTASTSSSPPEQAANPSPANSATGVNITVDLSWAAGSGATSHDVYFGTTSPGTFRGNQAGTTFDTGTMANSTTYYWRIDEKNAYGTTTGVVWSFTTVVSGPDFTFVQASDPQMGWRQCGNMDYLWGTTISKINTINPAFVILTGDLLNTSSSTTQRNTYRSYAAGINPGIPIYTLPGNHDISEPPTLTKYNWWLANLAYPSGYANPWYSFTYGDSIFICLESGVLRSPGGTGLAGKNTEQINWLTSTLIDANAAGYAHKFVFMHIPLCINSVGEAYGGSSGWNMPIAVRQQLLGLFHQYGVEAVFSGHYHRNAYVLDSDLEIITTASCTCGLGSPPATPGIRIIKVYSDHIEQEFRTLNSLP